MPADVSGLRILAADLSKAGVATTLRASQVVRKSAADVEAHMKANMQRAFRPPPEGDATGATANSVHVTMNGLLSAAIGPTTSYAVYLEFGTYKMAARPTAGPALDAVEPGFTAAMEQLGGDIL